MSMKNLKVTDETHRRLKIFCAENSLKIVNWVELVIDKEIDAKQKYGIKKQSISHLGYNPPLSQREAMSMAQRKKLKSSTTKYTGISKSGNKWKARICIGGKPMYIGTFNTEELAAEAYLKKANAI